MSCSRFASAAMILAVPLVLGMGTASAQTAKPELTWAPCGDVPDTECAGLLVPIDYAKPDGAKITLRIARAPALDAAKRKGVLLLLPGGPGVGIMEIMAGELLWHLSAKDTAQDVERIREALSLAHGIVSYAASYGSNYGAAYLEAYPENVKVLILDGVVDHTVDFATFSARNVMSVQDAFDRFAQWCAQDATCELHGKDLGAAFDTAIAREPKTRTLVPQLLATGDNPELGWPALARMLAEVGRGESKLLKEMTATASLSTADDPWLRVGKDGLFRAVMCADYGPQRDYAKLAATADTLGKAAPRFVWKFWDSMPMAHASAGTGDCVGWPREAVNPPHQLKVGPHRNVMVSNPTHDPATPLASAVSVWLQIPQARLLIADVDGHQSLPLSKCAYEAEGRFLADPASASSTTLCGK